MQAISRSRNETHAAVARKRDWRGERWRRVGGELWGNKRVVGMAMRVMWGGGLEWWLNEKDRRKGGSRRRCRERKKRDISKQEKLLRRTFRIASGG